MSQQTHSADPQRKPDLQRTIFESQPQFRLPTREVPLPTEVIAQILFYIPRHVNTQSTFWATSLISRSWYECSVSILYERPYINGANFDLFVRTACPSKNAHIRNSPLAALVRRLDMGELVHNSSRSLTARLLGRLKGNLEEFVAPQASFGINSIAPLSKCSKLRYLDLSLISAPIPRIIFFHTIRSLENLETLFFPRSSSARDHDPTNSHRTDREIETYTWPPRLKVLHLAGGISESFILNHLVSVPSSLERLSIQHCQLLGSFALLHVLHIIGPQLQHLTIRHPMSKLYVGALDMVLSSCSSLVALRISADYVSPRLFEQGIPHGHPLQILDLDCSSMADPEVGVDPAYIRTAIVNDLLPDLRSVRISARLAWQATATLRADALDLAAMLEIREEEHPLGLEAGVWSFVD